MSTFLSNSLQVSTDYKESEFEDSQFERESEKKSKAESYDYKDGPEKSSHEEDIAKPVGMFSLFRFATCGDKLLLVVAVLCAMANGVVMPLFSIILGSFFDDFSQQPDPNNKHFFRDLSEGTAKLFLYLAAGTFVVSFCQMGFTTIAAERQVLRMRKRYLAAVLSQEIKWFDARQSGELSAKISENTVVIKEAIGDKFASMFQFGAMFVSGFAVGFYFSWKLTLVIAAITPFLALAGFLMMKAMGDFTSNGLGAYAKAGSIVEETLTNIRTVTAFNAQTKILSGYDQYLRVAEKNGMQKSLRLGLTMAFVMFVMLSCYALTFFYGGILIAQDRTDTFKEFSVISQECVDVAEKFGLKLSDFCASSKDVTLLDAVDNGFNASQIDCPCGCSHPDADCLTGGDVVLVLFSVLMGSFALGQAAPSVSAVKNGQASAATIFSIIGRKPEIEAKLPDDENDGNNMPKNPPLSGRIVLEDVDFTYPTREDSQIFHKLNLSIEPGKSTALVGGSGCGKSTVMALIQRFYDPNGGTVWYQGKDGEMLDLRDLNLADFRNELGLVSQEPVLFATTIAKNIAYGAKLGEEASEEDIINAAKSANAYDFIMEFPEQFNTMVGERGAQLSGGQKQRIAIARAILRNPTFLLLDEATSALDNESERIVQRALDNLLQDNHRTTIVIAHRLSTIRDCDKIIVLGEGRVLEEGTHQDLMSLENGTYNMLVNAANKTQEQPGSGIRKAAFATEVPEEKIVKEELLQGDIVVDVEPDSPDDEKVDKDKPYKVPFSRIFGLSAPEKCLYIPGIIGAIFNGCQQPFFAIIFSDISTALFDFEASEIRHNANNYALLFLGLAILAGIGNFMQFYCFGIIAEKMTRRVRRTMFTAILKQEIAFFDDPQNSVGSLSSGLSTDAALVKANIADRTSLGAQNLATVVAGLTIAFINGWELTLILLGVLPLLVLSGALQIMVFASIMSADEKHMKPASQVLQESVAGIRTVTAFNAKNRVVSLYQTYLDVPMKLGKRKGVVAGLSFGFSQGIMFVINAGAFYIGADFIDRGIFDFNQMLTVFFAVLMTAMGLGQSAAMAPDIAKGSAAVSNVFKIVDRNSKIDPSDDSGERDIPEGKYSLTFENLKFAYPARPDVKIFDEFNLNIPAGGTVALVGSSGSGKSTIVSLLQRFYDPAEGAVLVGESSDIRSQNVAWWRNQIGLVEQEPKLFATSIKENIKYGIPDDVEPTDELIISAAKAANAHNFITEFPDGYETLVGEQGAQLSGGQKQRICIARAIIRKPQLLLLDEATSALDNKSEKVVQAALDKLLDERVMTTVVVAHRLTTIQNADMIVVMAHGKVLEIGEHDQLLERNGAYANLWYSQRETLGE